MEGEEGEEGRQDTAKHWSRVQRFEGPEVKGKVGGHRSRVTSGSLQPTACFHPKPNQVSFLSQQCALKERRTTGGHVPWACTTGDKQAIISTGQMATSIPVSQPTVKKLQQKQEGAWETTE